MFRMERSIQHRVLLYTHDGLGLGHLRRMSRIAAALQGPCACLLLTGLRDASWVVPTLCEYVYLPSWNSVRPKFAGYLGRPLWWTTSTERKMELRTSLIRSVFDSFRPHAVLVDHLPGGYEGELLGCLERFRGLAYFVLRGLLDSPEKHRLSAASAAPWGHLYHRILVAADSKIVDVKAEYEVAPLIAQKLVEVGYIGPEPRNPLEARARHGVASGQQWVVCSGGAGYRAEDYLEYCTSVASAFPQVRFDVVFGPMSRRTAPAVANPTGNLRTWSHHRDLPNMHAACDVVVCSGGYNTLVEAISGGAQLIVDPKQIDGNDEQRNNATRWSRYYPLMLSHSQDNLREKIATALTNASLGRGVGKGIEMGGVENVRRIVTSDLAGMADELKGD
jgi:predicted glycosyltransferase